MPPIFLTPLIGYILGAILAVTSGIAIGYRYASHELTQYKLSQETARTRLIHDLESANRKLHDEQAAARAVRLRTQTATRSKMETVLRVYDRTDCNLPDDAVGLLKSAVSTANGKHTR